MLPARGGEPPRPDEPERRPTRSARVAAVCYRQGDGVIEFLLVRSGRGQWTIPMGSLVRDEGSCAAAERTALEQAGATGRASRSPLTTMLLDAGPWEEGGRPEVDAYLLHVDRRQLPATRDREPTWFASDEAERVLTAHRRSYEAAELHRLVWEACRAIKESTAVA